MNMVKAQESDYAAALLQAVGTRSSISFRYGNLHGELLRQPNGKYQIACRGFVYFAVEDIDSMVVYADSSIDADLK